MAAIAEVALKKEPSFWNWDRYKACETADDSIEMEDPLASMLTDDYEFSISTYCRMIEVDQCLTRPR